MNTEKHPAGIFDPAWIERATEQELRDAHQRLVSTIDSISDGFVSLDRQFRVTFINKTGARFIGQTRESMLGRVLWEVFPEAVGSDFERAYNKAMAEKVTTSVEAFYQPLNAWFEARAYPSEDGLSVFFQDITDRWRVEQTLRDSEARFRLLADTAAQLLATRDPLALVNTLANRVRAHLGCHCFFYFMADEGFPGRLKLTAWAGIPAEAARRIEWLDCGVVRDAVSLAAEHCPTTPDVHTELVTSYEIKAYACHPLTGVNGRILGTLSFGARDRETFSADDLALMKAVTDQVAAALVRMQNDRDLRRSADALQQANESLEEKVRRRTSELEDSLASLKNEIIARTKIQTQLHQLSRKSLEALETDRRNVSRELHDSIGGSLAAIKWGLEEIAEQALRGTVCVPKALATLVAHLADTIKETKRISANLRPLSLDDLGLLPTIEWYTRQFRRRFGNIRVICQIEVAEDELPEESKIVIYRVLQEALTNVARHSRADTVCISLSKSASHVEFAVEDNGCGFDASDAFRGLEVMSGFGLKSMRERAEISGGVLDLISRPGGGTSVRVTLPFSPALSGVI